MTDATMAAAGETHGAGKIHGGTAVAAFTDTVTMEPR
jgi:hypothetical protein